MLAVRENLAAKGIDGAFGGIFADAYQAPAERSTPNRAADAFQRAYNKSEERVDRPRRPDLSGRQQVLLQDVCFVWPEYQQPSGHPW